MTTTPIRCALAVATLLGAPALARAADAPKPDEVLGKLHEANLKEIEMGKMAEKNGQSKDVKAFGKMLVRDHTAADKKVKAVAKQEKVDLAAKTPEKADHTDMGTGADFDKKFAKDMLDDHKKDVDDMKKARDNTDDPKLKKLLTDVVPVLEKHQETAQKIVDETK